MLSIGKLTRGAESARYYEQSVATGREDYYTGEGESRGEWVGGGAATLGLEGDVADGELETLLVEARHPRTGEPLRPGGGFAVQGFDLTFSAPKSVSVLFAAGDEQVRTAVVRGHEAAVRDALGYLEREAVQVRRGAAGAVKEHAGGLIAGAYRHRTSRAGDPQLHTHVVAANLAQGADGRWTALHAAPLYAHAKTVGYLYQAALRDQLSRSLGVQWGPVVKGAAEIEGMPREALEHFSQRRAEILDALHVRGLQSAAAARAAALETRQAKTYGVSQHTIYERWQARAAEHGLTRDMVAGVLDREPVETTDEQVRAAAQLMAGKTGITAQASTFGRREALQAWAELHPSGADVARIEALADRWLASDLVVRVDGEAGPVARSQVISTRHGARVAVVEDRYSTPDMLATERRLVEAAAARVGQGTGVADAQNVADALATRPYLADEQRGMVRALTSSGDGLQVVLAKAGAGKTTALDAAREAWQRSGLLVQGTALGSYATNELRDSGIPACTIARLLVDIDEHGLARGSVLSVDEAGMVGTRTLDRLANHAERAEAKLVLVGDDKQLPEIDAGGAFRGLARRLGAIELHDNRRQHDPEDRRVLDAHRAGRPDELIDSLARRGRITVAPDVQQTRQALVADWWQGAQAEGIEQVAMIALRRSEVRELNHLARHRMRDAGRLTDRELHVDGRAFAVGDRVVTRTNAPYLGVVNGSRGEITHIHDDTAITLRLDDGHTVDLPPRYVTGWRDQTPNLDHGYAITANGIQGGTVERSYVLASEEAFQEWGYVAASRHRVETRFYVTASDSQSDQLALDGTPPTDPLRDIVRALGQSRAKGLAIDAAAQGELRTMPDDRLRSEAGHLRSILETAPTAAAHKLDVLTSERSRVAAEVERSAQTLDQTSAQLAGARWRERRVLRERVAGAHRAAATWRERLAHVDQRIAQVREHLGDPDAWLDDRRHAIGRLAAVETELARREHTRRIEALRLVTIDPPAYVTQELGPRPEEFTLQRRWDQGARTIESYRQRHGHHLAPDQPGLGPPPRVDRERRVYHAAARRLDDVKSELGLQPPTCGPVALDRGR
ncbi:ATP-dependent RecD-like DNA helicase [Capillimicrobium parvum]|uniref:ATP-dependent RecD-like DNA helicase n=1 Tax=Capillimicrobium parvum TaxID=2884022 RepID=A0A9E6XX45_9ACTN|nr:ATP-dependent RecD-like DNA helicase [Capillimicrobium parvum]